MTVPGDRVPWTPQLLRVMAGLMLSLFVAATDTTVVGTALPTIARELGQFSLYPWVFSGYLITATTTVPIWGRLADLHGRRRILLVGMAIFVIASVLCGLSPGMGWLIAFRTLQGVGAGALQPAVYTIVGDIFPVAQRARLQGFFSSMWAVASVVGPALGALFVSTVGWRWIFVVNLPVGLVATLLLWGYREHRPAGAGAAAGLDLRGAALLTAGIAALLWGLGTGSQSAQPTWPLVLLAVALLAGFGLVEARSSAPVLPLELLRHRLIGPAVAVAALSGTVMFGVTAYVPLYVQHVLGGSAYAAGTAVATMSLGWPLASVLAGWTMIRVGYERLVVGGAAVLLAGCLSLAFLTAAQGLAAVAAGAFLVGFGLGLFSAPLLIVIQSSVGWSLRGAATALNQFSRTIGGAVGVALMGLLLQSHVRGASDPLAATARLAEGVRADFLVLVGLAALVLAAALAILATRRSQGRAEVPGLSA